MQFDTERLGRFLVRLYAAEALRKVAVRFVYPMVRHGVVGTFLRRARRRARQAEKKKRARWSDDEKPNPAMERALEEMRLPEVELTDGYMDMCIEFGYIVLFASSFPLCSAAAMLSFVLNAKIDTYKFTHWHRRPPATRASRKARVWHEILGFTVTLSFITNCVLFSFSDAPMLEWFWSIFVGADANAVADKTSEGRYVILVCFVVIRMLITTTVPTVTEPVDLELRKLRYDRATEALVLRQEKIQFAKMAPKVLSKRFVSNGMLSSQAALAGTGDTDSEQDSAHGVPRGSSNSLVVMRYMFGEGEGVSC